MGFFMFFVERNTNSFNPKIDSMNTPKIVIQKVTIADALKGSIDPMPVRDHKFQSIASTVVVDGHIFITMIYSFSPR
jgi:hypothetical protein